MKPSFHNKKISSALLSLLTQVNVEGKKVFPEQKNNGNYINDGIILFKIMFN
jgi:hypothetical protein